MIISASRRTDIPNYYSDWFFERLKERMVCVRNPFRPGDVSRISLSRDVVDGFVFWTKNPRPMLKRLGELEEFPYYFQFTLNGYGVELEPGLPDKETGLVPVFQELSEYAGRERVIWRYDPILVTPEYTVLRHQELFGRLAEKLAAYTRKVVISFLDPYTNIQGRLARSAVQEPEAGQMEQLARQIGKIASEYGLDVETCAEAGDYVAYGIRHGKCIDASLLGRIAGEPLSTGKDTGQRKFCGCDASIDIGAYHTCQNRCVYCYAGHKSREGQTACEDHKSSPLLEDEIRPGDVIRDRRMKSDRETQLSLDQFLKM